MNGTNPCVDKTPIRAAIEDSLVVFVYATLTALAAMAFVDGISWKAMIFPVLTAAIQGTITWARVRNIQLPIPTGDKNE